METLYEEYRDDDERLEVQRNRCDVFQAHFHRNLEILVVNRGLQRVMLNGETYTVGAGDVLLCSSYDLHAYGDAERENQDNCVVIVPTRYTVRFNERNKGLHPSSPVVHDEELCRELLSIADKWMRDEKETENVRGAATGLFLSLIEKKLNFIPEKEKDETQLIRKILSYLSEHFREDVSLPKLAAHFGYTEAHLSRVFHRYTHTGLPRYVNRLRLNCVDSALRFAPSADLTQVVFDSGFKSLPTYYRAKAQESALKTAPS